MEKVLVAKSYIDLEQVGDPFIVNGKKYIKVRLANGSLKTVRVYSEAEYNRYYPEVKIIKPAKSRREVLGFGEKGYIWIFKGNTYENLSWFQQSPCCFNKWFGWFLASDIALPDQLPFGISAVKLHWSEVSEDDNTLKSDEAIKTIVESIIYEKSNSEYVGEVGERIDVTLYCKKTVEINSYYGTSTLHTFEDEDGNEYVWTTSSKTLNEDTWYQGKATVKGHNIYHNCKQTLLKNCRFSEVEKE